MCPIFEKNPNSCPSGGILYKGVRGLNVHYSRAHKAEHLAALEAKTSQSAPIRTWSNEEIRFLAHAEFERRERRNVYYIFWFIKIGLIILGRQVQVARGRNRGDGQR